LTSVAATAAARIASAIERAAAIASRKAAFDAAFANEGSGLPAILIHVQTHRTGEQAIHKANAAEDSERILKDLDKQDLAVRTRVSGVLAANPQDAAWRRYIAACYAEVREGDINPDVAPNVAEQVIATAEADFTKGDDAAVNAAATARRSINETLALAIQRAYEVDLRKVTDALRHSKVDGDPAKHPAALDALATLYAKSTWVALAAEL